MAAILGPETAEVVLDMGPCSWALCAACAAGARAMIAGYPDGPTRLSEMGPGLILVAGLTPLGAPFLASESVGDALDCRKRHGMTKSGGSSPSMPAESRPAGTNISA